MSSSHAGRGPGREGQSSPGIAECGAGPGAQPGAPAIIFLELRGSVQLQFRRCLRLQEAWARGEGGSQGFSVQSGLGNGSSV